MCKNRDGSQELEIKMKKKLAKIIEWRYIGFDIQTGNRFNTDSGARYSWLTPTDSAMEEVVISFRSLSAVKYLVDNLIK